MKIKQSKAITELKKGYLNPNGLEWDGVSFWVPSGGGSVIGSGYSLPGYFELDENFEVRNVYAYPGNTRTGFTFDGKEYWSSSDWDFDFNLFRYGDRVDVGSVINRKKYDVDCPSKIEHSNGRLLVANNCDLEFYVLE